MGGFQLVVRANCESTFCSPPFQSFGFTARVNRTQGLCMKRALIMTLNNGILRAGQLPAILAFTIAFATFASQNVTAQVSGQQNGSTVVTAGANSNRMTLHELLGKTHAKPKPDKPTVQTPPQAKNIKNASRLPQPPVIDSHVRPVAFAQDQADWRVEQNEVQQTGSFISAVDSQTPQLSNGVLGSQHGNRIPLAVNQPAYESAPKQTGPAQARRIPRLDTAAQQVQQISHPAPVRNVTTPVRPATYILQNTNYEQFEQRLMQTWGARLKGEPLNADQSILRITMPAGEKNNSSSMVFDRRAGQLTFEGERKIAQAWLQTMIVLDENGANSEQASRLIETRLLQGKSIKHVVYHGLPQGQDEIERRVPIDPNQEFDTDAMREFMTNQLMGEVTIEFIPELGVLSLKGDPEDVAKVEAAIDAFGTKARATAAVQKVIELQNIEPSDTLVTQLNETYMNFYESREGPVSISAVEGTPKLLVVGRESAVFAVQQLVSNLDAGGQAEQATGDENYIVRKLKHISAADAAARINEYYRIIGERPATDQETPNVLALPDPRSNTLIVRAGPSFRKEIIALIDALDVDESQFKGVVRVFQIRNTIAGELGQILQDILVGSFAQNDAERGFLGTNIQTNQGNAGNTTEPGPGETTPGIRSLEIQTESGGRVGGGILFGIRITADANSNTLTVNASEKTMPLIAELIQRLDRLPNVETQLKVYEVIHGDANDLLDTLNLIFGVDDQAQTQGQNTALGTLPLESTGASDGSTLVGLRFAVNERTNEIIATGPASELESVFALLTRLDSPDLNQPQRQVNVYRLSNVFVSDIEAPLQTWLTDRDTILQEQFLNANGTRNLQQNRVTIVAEPSSNSMIVSAMPQYMPEVEHVIKALDRRPPMVEVKALLAEVNLDYLEEFGIEFGIQDSSIFNAGLGNLGAGFVGLDNVAGQIRSDLGVGNANGFVFSAGNDSVNLLLRALRNKNCVRVLSKPHIMTLENLQGTINVGETVPRIEGVQNIGLGQTQTVVNDVEIGVQLQITPRVSPDGMITMNVQVANITFSDLAVAIGTDANGDPLLSNRLTNTTATTTIMARSGQTVVFSGLIQEDKSHSDNGLPILSDLPVIGPLFNFTSDSARRSELIIILTPRIIKGAEDLDAHNKSELSRMHWCMCDVAEIYGDPGIPNTGEYSEQTPKIYYPDTDPMGNSPIINDPMSGFSETQFQNYNNGAQAPQMMENFQQPRTFETQMPRQIPQQLPRNIQTAPSYGSQIQMSPSDALQQQRVVPQPQQNLAPRMNDAIPANPLRTAPATETSPFQPYNNSAPPAPSIPQSYRNTQPANQPYYQGAGNRAMPPYSRAGRQDVIARQANARLSKADSMMREMKRNY